MEQGNLPPSPPRNEGEVDYEALQKPEQEASWYTTAKRIGAVAAISTVGAAIAFIGIRGAQDIGNDQNPLVHGAQIGQQNYEPITNLDDSSPTREAASDSMLSEYETEGRTTGLFGPNSKTRKVLNSYFNNNEIGETPNTPGLREVAYMQDQVIFEPEFGDNPDNLYRYPFSIFNTTEHPVDLVFIDYAVRSTKSWLAEKEKTNDGFIVGGHTRTKVQPRGVPHALIMTDVIPPSLVEALPKSDGVTRWYENLTTSFVKDTGPDSKPFVPWIVATEVCQALVDVYDQTTVPGQKQEQRSVQEFVASFNDDAMQNLDLTVQEISCNALGRVISAAYTGEREAIDQLPSEEDEVGSTQTPWLDYTPFESQLPVFISLSRQARNGDSKVITIRDGKSPTVRFYSQNEGDENSFASHQR